MNSLFVMPSNQKAKQFVFSFFVEKELEELEQNESYLTGKLVTEVIMTAQFIVAGGKIVITGMNIFTNGAVKIGAGGTLNCAGPFGSTIAVPLAAVGVGEVVAGSVVAISGTYYMAKAVHSGQKAFETSDKLKGATNSKKMLGENGTQFESKTVWQKGKTERIDVENPAPSERPGQIHYHEADNTKWYFDVDEKLFYDQKTGEVAPKRIQDLLKDKDVINAINKALKFLGENKL